MQSMNAAQVAENRRMANPDYTYSNFKYTYVESLFGTYSNVYMPNSPTSQLCLDLQATPMTNLVFGLGVALQTRSYVDATNLTWAGGYTLLNARAAYTWRGRWHRGEVSLALLNLTGKEYIALTEPDPDGNSYQPAPTRQVFASVRLSLGPD